MTFAASYMFIMVTLRIVARIGKEIQVLFNLCKGMWRYMDDVACCCLGVVGRKQGGCVSVVTWFLGFSEDDGRVLASSSFRVFLVGCGMPGKERMKKIPCRCCLVTSHRAYVICVRSMTWIGDWV